MTHELRSARRLVLLGITAAVFAACAGTGAASPSAPVSPSANALPDGVASTNDGPLGAGSASGPARAGTYQSHAFRPVVRFTVPAGWSGGSFIKTFVGSSETRDGLAIANGAGGIVFTVPTSVDPPAPAERGAAVPADLFAWIQSNPNLELGAVTDVTIGGVHGQSVEGVLSADAKIDASEDAYRMVDFLPLLPRQSFRLVVLTVGTSQVIVATIANTADFKAFKDAADAVIATVEFPAS